jgi:hypothetical protein
MTPILGILLATFAAGVSFTMGRLSSSQQKRRSDGLGSDENRLARLLYLEYGFGSKSDSTPEVQLLDKFVAHIQKIVRDEQASALQTYYTGAMEGIIDCAGKNDIKTLTVLLAFMKARMVDDRIMLDSVK